MVNYELGLELPEGDYTKQNMKEGSITFGSFVFYKRQQICSLILYHKIDRQHQMGRCFANKDLIVFCNL